MTEFKDDKIKPNVQPSKAHIMRAKTPPLSHR